MEVRLSDAEKVFVIHGAQEGLRSDGRGVLDYRPIIVETGVLPTTNGSARVRIGCTDLLIGIKADLVVVEDMSAYNNRLNFSVDCSANATPEFAGRGGDDFGIEIASALSAAYDNPFVIPDLAKLIVSPMHAWKIYVDVVILQFGGNILDAASIGVKAALFDTEICEVLVRPGDAGKKVVDILDDSKVWKLDTSKAPFVLSVNKLGGANVMDVSLTERACVRASLWVGISIQSDESLASEDNCSITFLRQCGGGALEMESVGQFIVSQPFNLSTFCLTTRFADEMLSCATRIALELNSSFRKRLTEIAKDENNIISTFLT